MRLLLALLVLGAAARAQDDAGLGLAGLLSAANKEGLPPITLSAGAPLADAPLRLRSGTYYEIEITADGSQELALAGPEFFRAVWVDEIVIEGLEVRPLGLDSVEFDQAGTMEVGFVAIRPGTYELRVPQSTGDTQRLEVVIE